MPERVYFQPSPIKFHPKKKGNSVYLQNEFDLTDNPAILKFNWFVFFHRVLCLFISGFWFYLIIASLSSNSLPITPDVFGILHFYTLLFALAIFNMDKSVKIWGNIGNSYLLFTMILNLILSGGMLSNSSSYPMQPLTWGLILLVFVGSIYILFITIQLRTRYPNHMLNVPDAVECYKKTAHYRVPVIIISSLLVIWALSYPIGVMTNAFTHTPLFGQVSQSFWSILLSNNASVEYNWVILVGITIGIVLFSYYDVFIKAEHTAIKRGAFYHPTGAKILIIGAGAIGGITGAYLTMAGEKVILFDTNQEHVHQMQDHGLEIIGKRGSLRVKIFAASSNEELIEQYQNLFEVPEGSPLFDFIILGVKSAYTEAAVKHIMPYMSPEGVICTVQNSINDQTIANLVGEDHVIHCVTMWGGTNLGPGKLEQTSLGPFDIGECGEVKDTPRIHTLQKILNNFASTKIFPDILKAAWRKLMLNGVMNTYGLIFGERCFELFNNPKILPIVMATIREEALVAKQIVGPLGSENMIPMDQFIFDQNLSLRGVQDRASVLKIISSISGRIKSSMLQDYEKGLKTENEYLLGYFIRENSKFAEQNNIEALPIPFIHRAFEVATKVENGELQPSMESHQIFNDLFDSMPAFWRDSNNFKLNTLGQRIILTLITAVGQIIAPK